MVDFYEMIYQWAEWAAGVVEQWPDDPSQAEPTLDVDRYILQRAELRAARDLGDQ
jgi:PadR family transcriptional regulator, regulatory protein AphA